MKEMRSITLGLVLFLAPFGAPAQTKPNIVATNATPAPALSATQRGDDARNMCIANRRVVCGRVLKVFSDGLVVESGYTELTRPPLNQSWLVNGGAVVNRDPKALELNEPGSPCIGIVFLTNIPKRPAVKQYDYITLQAYPTGQHTYTSVPGVDKTVRCFSASLDAAIRVNLEAGEKTSLK